MSTAISKSAIDNALKPLLASAPNIKKLLPAGMNDERFFMQVRRALMNNPALAECQPATLIGAVLEAADLGLDPSGRLGSAYLVPYKGKVTLIPGYRGLIDLAGRSGLVRSINAWAVYEKDEFRVRHGFTPEHIPFMSKTGEAPGQWYAVWARARMVGGVTEAEVMMKHEVLAIKARSPSAKSDFSPWNSDEVEMARKTVIRRLIKKLPLSPTPQWDRLSKALDLADGAVIEGQVGSSERAVSEVFELQAEATEATDEARESPVDALKNKL